MTYPFDREGLTLIELKREKNSSHESSTSHPRKKNGIFNSMQDNYKLSEILYEDEYLIEEGLNVVKKCDWFYRFLVSKDFDDWELPTVLFWYIVYYFGIFFNFFPSPIISLFYLFSCINAENLQLV